MEPVYLGEFKAYTTKEGMSYIGAKDLDMIVLHIQRQPVVLVGTIHILLQMPELNETIINILNQAGAK